MSDFKYLNECRPEGELCLLVERIAASFTSMLPPSMGSWMCAPMAHGARGRSRLAEGDDVEINRSVAGAITMTLQGVKIDPVSIVATGSRVNSDTRKNVIGARVPAVALRHLGARV